MQAHTSLAIYGKSSIAKLQQVINGLGGGIAAMPRIARGSSRGLKDTRTFVWRICLELN